MKKIIIAMCMFLFFVSVGNANRDSVRNIPYSTVIKGPFNIELKTHNMACGIEKTHNVDIFSILNFTGKDGVSCLKGVDNLECTKIIDRFTGPTLEGDIQLMATKKEILQKMGVSPIISDNVIGNYIQDISVKMKIMITTGYGNTRFGIEDGESKFSFTDIQNPFSFTSGNNTLEYSDKSECAYVPQDPDKTYCGDGEIQTPNDDGESEECDGGENCTGGCKNKEIVVPQNPDKTYCGDGEIQTPNDDGESEECDGGENCTGGCKNKEIVVPQNPDKTYCGDGEIQTPNDDGESEECDGGENCTGGCKNKEVVIPENPEKTYCGDGEIQTPNDDGESEECDGGVSCTGGCKDKVVVTPPNPEKTYCGDGEIQAPNDYGITEKCDGGADCTSSCKNVVTPPNLEKTYCGDGEIQTLNDYGVAEQCDGGSNCTSSCKQKPGKTYCGDGVIQTLNDYGVAEQCDGGSRCTSSCKEKPGKTYCGDGEIQALNDYGVAEQCDGGDSCTSSCKNRTLIPEKTYCGDGSIQAPNSYGVAEQCDGGDNCTGTCRNKSTDPEKTYCGDGGVQNPNDFGVEEDCDGGDNCTPSCNNIIDSIPIENPEPICLPGQTCLTDGIQSPVFDYIAINNCYRELDNSYTCFANEKINISAKLSYLGNGYSPKGIEKIDFSINNASNTASLNSGNTDFEVRNSAEKRFNITNNLFKQIGEYTLEFKGEGKNDNPATWTNLYNIKLNIIPNNDFKVNGEATAVPSSVPANAASKIKVCQGVTDSFGNQVGTNYTGSSNDIDIIDGILLDQKSGVTNSANEALLLSSVTFQNSKYCFDVASLSPDKKKLKFDIDVPKHEQKKALIQNGKKKLAITTSELEFTRLFTGEILIDELNTGDNMLIGSGYTLSTNIIGSGYEPKSLSELGTISFADGYVANNQSTSSNKTTFDFNYGGNSSITSASFNLEQKPYISYSIAGKTTKYRLTPGNAGDDNAPLVYSVGSEFMGVEIIGTFQGQGKQEITGQDSNISDISKMGLRGDIRKKAYQYVQSMSDGEVLNKVKYVVGDIDIGGDLSYETLVVKNGNITISSDLNLSDNKLGIIVLQDNFTLGGNRGNIIIEPGVKKINAVIYADGGIISVSTGGEQLYLNGALFTRNTIGGAIGASNTFILPGGESTTDHPLAKKYDLNHVRSGNVGWDMNLNGIEDADEVENATFVIKYNSNIQTNPPKLFEN